jgi:hypothetical protein
MWIGATKGAPMVSCTCGIEGLWRKSQSVGDFSIACSFRNVEDGFSWAFAGVCGPKSDGDRRLQLEELASLLSW